MDYSGIPLATGFDRYLGSNTPVLPLRDMGIRTDKAILKGLCLFYHHGNPEGCVRHVSLIRGHTSPSPRDIPARGISCGEKKVNCLVI